MDSLLVLLAAAAGGTTSAVLGWIDAKEPFDGRKFAKSMIVTWTSAIAFTLAFQGTASLRDLFLVYLATSGSDVIVNRVGFGKA